MGMGTHIMTLTTRKLHLQRKRKSTAMTYRQTKEKVPTVLSPQEQRKMKGFWRNLKEMLSTVKNIGFPLESCGVSLFWWVKALYNRKRRWECLFKYWTISTKIFWSFTGALFYLITSTTEYLINRYASRIDVLV